MMTSSICINICRYFLPELIFLLLLVNIVSQFVVRNGLRNKWYDFYKKLCDKRKHVWSHKYLTSLADYHRTWPHYFSLMSCHTWQKCDTNNKNKTFVLRGWSAGSLGAQSEDLLRGLHSSSTMGGFLLQRSCHLLTWNKVVKHPTKHPALFVFYLWISSIKRNCHMFCFAGSRKAKRWNEETKAGNRKKGTLDGDWCIFNLCHGHK